MARTVTRPAAPRRTTVRAAAAAPVRDISDRSREIVAWLQRHGSQKVRDGMARYAIPSDKAFGISMAAIQQQARRHGRSHELAAALWDTGWYEARTMACYVEEPARVTPAQMDRWCRDFDNWAICDTACFVLFDKTPYAWRKVEQWSRRRDEIQKRAAFVLLACLALHDKAVGDDALARHLPLLEQGADDARNFVKKAVSWALRAMGGRSSPLHHRVTDLARRLVASPEPGPRWVGKDVLQQLSRPAVLRRLAAAPRTKAAR